MPLGQKKTKRQFKPKKKEAQVEAKIEPEPEFVANEANDKKKRKGSPEKKQRLKPQREIIQTKSVFSAEGVERRGYGGKSGFGSGGGGGGGGVRRTIGEDFQARAPLVSRDRKVWTKQEIKEEEEQAEKALKELYLEDKMATYDKKLFSEPDYIPVQVGFPLKEINKIRKEESDETNIVDQELLEALKSGKSDQIFLFQMSDLPIMPRSAGEDDYDPNEEVYLGDLNVEELSSGLARVGMNVGEMKMNVVPGSDPHCFTELARMTASSYQVVGHVSKKYVISPDFEHLLGRTSSEMSEQVPEQVNGSAAGASVPPSVVKTEPGF